MKRLAIALLALPILTCQAQAVCLTKAEARKLWPKEHLYWYSKDYCWSNRRGPPKNIKTEPIANRAAIKTALIAVAQEPQPSKMDREPVPTPPDPWANAQPLKVRVIEFTPPVEAAPAIPVESAPLVNPQLRSSHLPPPKFAEILAVLGGGSLAAMVSFVLYTRSRRYVKSSIVWVYQGAAKARNKVLQARARKRDLQSPLPEINIRDFVRRAERTGYAPYPWEVYDSLADLDTPSTSAVDDSAIACWARSIRT